MVYTITFPESEYRRLCEHLFQDNDEHAAYLLCARSVTASEHRLLVRSVIPVRPEDVEDASPQHLTILQRSFLPVLKQADISGMSFVLVHSHPKDFPNHSPQDDKEEPKLFKTAYTRIHSEAAVHASIVVSSPHAPVGRVWLGGGATEPVSRIRVIGRKFWIYDREKDDIDIAAFDRQVLAFGPAVQALLKRLVIGVVGLGGTGSAVVEQLIRLGVGRVIVCDPQALEKSNVNRVYGSRVSDEGHDKIDVAKRLAEEIGLGTTIEPLKGSITDLAIATTFRECDVVFGCTDDEWGRAVLTKLAVSYLIPVLDLAVTVDSRDQIIKSVRGRVTTLFPGSACLFCRAAITGDVIAAEIKKATNPGEYENLRKEGYVPELPGTAPSVIMFTSAVASQAIAELLHRITGFMGKDRVSTEVLLRLDESKLSRTARPPENGCWCAGRDNWAEGDVEPFLNMTWPNKSK
jgi:molybdopterin/thiamine biosynthesis adenylyltransferase